MTALKDQLKLEIEDTAGANLSPNPNGEIGLKPWYKYISGAGNATISVDTSGTPANSVNGCSFAIAPTVTTVIGMLSTKLQRVVPGEYIGAAATFWRPAGAAGTVTATVHIEYLTSSYVVISTTATTANVPANTSTTCTRAPVVAPANTAYARIRFGVQVSSLQTVYAARAAYMIADTSPNAAAAWVAPTYSEVIGKSIRVSYSQGNVLDGVEDKIEAGLLTAVVKDPTIDPASNSQIYRGRKVRLSALIGSAWVPQATMKIETLNTSYADDETVVTVTATDAGAVLNNTLLGTCGTASLESVLGSDIANATGLVTDDGTTTSPAIGNDEATLEGSTAADWLRRACNTHGGYAWVDKSDVVQGRSLANLSTTSTTFSDDHADTGATFYTKIDLATSSEAIVNSLLVRRINVDELEGSKEYGPFAVRASVQKWGIVDGSVEILAGVPLTIATPLLQTFATPAIFPRSVTFNATADITKATSLELYQKALVKRAGLLSASFRIIKISHEIIADNRKERWLTTIICRPLETGQPAITVLSPQAGALSGPADLAAYSTKDQNGTVALASGSGAVNSTVTYTKPFPPAMTPAVTVTSKNLELHTPRITSSSNTGFTVRWDRSSSGAYGYNWQAQPPTP